MTVSYTHLRKMTGLSSTEIEVIATTIESHMGEWCIDKRSGQTLPKPQNKYQKLVHLADYLASRKDIEVLFDGYEKKELPKIEDHVLNFGKYKGKTLVEINEIDPGYISWAKENMNREPERTLVKQL